MPSVPLPEWIRVRLNTIHTNRELMRLLRTSYVGGMAHPQWREWVAPRESQPAEQQDRIADRGSVLA